MHERRIFRTERKGATLVLVPLVNVSSLAAEHVQRELNEILGLIERREVASCVIDFEEIEFFGSEMLAVIQMIWKRSKNGGGRMAVCGICELGREVIHVAKFDLLWPIYDTREEALAAVGDQEPSGA